MYRRGFEQDVLSNLVERLRWRKGLNLADSDPLVRCVLALDDWEGDKSDLLEDAERASRGRFAAAGPT